MNWIKYILIIFGGLFILTALIHTINVAGKVAGPDRFNIKGLQTNLGVLDPTLAFNGDASYGVMAFTNVLDPLEGTGDSRARIDLASTYTQGDKWVYQGPVFDGRTDQLLVNGAADKPVTGVWRYEMPTLVYTPGDAKAPWKIYAYRYFWANDIALARRTGVIVYKTTTDPRQGWGAEKWLFSANQNNPPDPYNKLVLMHLNTLDSSLNDVVAYGDPGAFFQGGTLYLTFSAYTRFNTQSPDRIVMVASNDFGQSWYYIGNVLTQGDLDKMDNFSRMHGAQIIPYKGTAHLLVALGDKLSDGKGTYVMKFDDIARGLLMRDSDGRPQILNDFELSAETLTAYGGGQADYDPANHDGLLISGMNRQLPDQPFYIRTYGHKILD